MDDEEFADSQSEMEEDDTGYTDTQALTQRLEQEEFDPRRRGIVNSGLADNDAADVFCVLTPASPAAYRIVRDTIISKPQHVLQNEPWRTSGQTVFEQQQNQLSRSRGGEALDLALRFSSPVVDLDVGFLFGRNSQVCDINLDKEDKQKRVSNMHFRIFINEQGILMMEDLSSNGTIVDQKPIGGRQRRTNGPRMHMLTNGSIIEILGDKPEDVIKFVLRIPGRDGFEVEYEDNFHNYMYRRALYHVHKQQGLPLPTGGVQSLLRTQVPGNARVRSSTIGINPPGKSGGYGMHWNGGEKYICTGVVGKGAFATVYQIATRWNGDLYAAKELEKKHVIKDGKLDSRLTNELDIMKNIRHSHIVDYIDYHETPTHLYIIMEYIRYGDLGHWMTSTPGMIRTLPESSARTMTMQVLDALSYLHQKNVTHRDIKPDNILIYSEEPFNVKLTDFGLSKMVKDTTTFLKTFCGTLLYCAPEVFPFFEGDAAKRVKRRRNEDRRIYSHSVDIWSYAAVLWYAVCGQPAFEGIVDGNGRAMFNRIMGTSLDTLPLVRKGLSEECIDILLHMLDIDPGNRYSEAECFEHPWLRDNGHEISQDTRRLTSIPELEEGLDCSQLTLHEPKEATSSDQDSQSQKRETKRLKGDNFLALRDVPELPSSPEDSSLFAEMLDNPMTGPVGVQGDSLQSGAELTGQRQMSLRRSSGLFAEEEWEGLSDADMNENSAEGSPTTGGQDVDIHTQQYHLAHVTAASMSRNDTEEMDFEDSQPRQPPAFERQNQHLLESMVRDMKMVSPSTSGTAAALPDEPTTPKAKSIPPATPPRAFSKHVLPDPDVTPRPRQPAKFNRQIEFPIPPSFYYDPYNPATHNLEYANMMRNKAMALAESNKPNSVSASLPSTAIESVPSSAEVTHPQSTAQSKPNSQHTQASTSNKENEGDGDDHSIFTDLSQPLSIPSFPTVPSTTTLARPPNLYGRITSTPNSFTSVTLDLTQLCTSWGRNPSCTIVYPDPSETRIPKQGLEFWFHAPGIEAVDEAGGDWTGLEGLRVILTTESRMGVWVNGVHLLPGSKDQNPPRPSTSTSTTSKRHGSTSPQKTTRSASQQSSGSQEKKNSQEYHSSQERRDRAQHQEPQPQQPEAQAQDQRQRRRKYFGELFTGDVINMGAPASERKPFLEFKCEFFVGRATQRREKGTRFLVEEER